MASKIDEVRKAASAFLDELEADKLSAEGLLLKATRIARLMRDTDAQKWLGYETTGYPAKFNSSSLGTCEKYVLASGRIPEADKYYTPSLIQIDALCHTDEGRLKSFDGIAHTPPAVADFLVKNATEAFLTGQRNAQLAIAKGYQVNVALLASLKSAIHGYVTDVLLAIELGDIAQDIFGDARNSVDTFIRAYCPKAAEQLIAINERMADKTSESRTAALTSCRRVLLTVADSLFPPRSEDWTDAAGKQRKVGPEQYKNRLLAYLATAHESQGSKEVITSGIEHLAARLDAIYDKTNKGVHVDVSEQEARLAVIHTYLFIGEIANATSAISPK